MPQSSSNHNNAAATTDLNVYILGESESGKTSLCMSHANGEFPDKDNVPPVFESFYVQQHFQPTRKQRQLCSSSVGMTVHDTISNKTTTIAENIRQFDLANADVLVLTFSLNNKSTLDPIRARWMPLIRRATKAPIILVGTKADLRTHPVASATQRDGNKSPEQRSCVTQQEGKRAAQILEAKAYIETSSKYMRNLAKVFQHVMKAGVSYKIQKFYKSSEDDETDRRNHRSSLRSRIFSPFSSVSDMNVFAENRPYYETISTSAKNFVKS
eukprot:gb/GECH01003059.1/.p1 GENE.gb/GECH01003059.1/~~gb/GECH01003059.1/.p1  ORF type:complete len:270 (+),score=57.65 gb/GECH01003059.1/:1-810(+)